MTNEEFIAFHKRCKDAFGNIFRKGARVKPFPHNVYGWTEVAIDREGNVMVFSGDHGSSNPERVIGVLDGKVVATSHSNGRFQPACRTVSEYSDTYPTIVKVAYGTSYPTEVGMDVATAERAFEMLTSKAEIAKANNEAEDSKKAAILAEIRKYTTFRGFTKSLKYLHDQWFRWCRTIANSPKNTDHDKVFCSVSEWGCRGWHCNGENLILWGGPATKRYKGECSCGLSKAEGTEVSKETFYKSLVAYLKSEDSDFCENVDRFFSHVMCRMSKFSLVWDDGKERFFIKNFGNFPKNYPYRGAAWRDGLRKATEDEEKTITKWVKVCGDCKTDTAMVNWSKRVWRDPTEAELNELP